jgi:hypothetical protein
MALNDLSDSTIFLRPLALRYVEQRPDHDWFSLIDGPGAVDLYRPRLSLFCHQPEP